jgi:LysM repeat protein
MDTLSRDSSSGSSNILTYVAVGFGVIGLVIGGLAMAKASKLEKALAPQLEEINNKIAGVQNDVRSASAKSDNDMKNFRDQVQSVLTQVGNEIGAMKGQITRLEEAAKKPAPVAGAKGGKGGGAVTGTVDAEGNYVVAPGDTLNKIAKKFGIRRDAIEAENPGLDPAKLRVGQKIKIPKK